MSPTNSNVNLFVGCNNPKTGPFFRYILIDGEGTLATNDMPMDAAPDRDAVTHTWRSLVLVVRMREVQLYGNGRRIPNEELTAFISASASNVATPAPDQLSKNLGAFAMTGSDIFVGGRSDSDSGRFYTGAINSLTVFDVGLTTEEVTCLFMAQEGALVHTQAGSSCAFGHGNYEWQEPIGPASVHKKLGAKDFQVPSHAHTRAHFPSLSACPRSPTSM